MKKITKLCVAAVLTAGMVLGFTACGGVTTITKQPNVGISQGVADSVGSYDKIAYYSLEEKRDVKISLEADSVQKVSFMYRVLSPKDYTFKNNLLTVKKKIFEGQSAGDKILRVFIGGQYLQITVRIVSKVIYTVDDFNAIRHDLNGSYTLANDLDFSNEAFWPIGKSYDGGNTGIFEGVFDGGGHSIKNVTINAMDRGAGEDGEHQGPSLGNPQSNPQNYNNGIFMQTSGNAQIINTNFVNVTLNCQGLGGAVVGMNGGLVKNCFVSCNLTSRGDAERAGGIAGVNGSNDAPGKIENCIVIYNTVGESQVNRGIADWNNGTISNCYAATTDSFVFHPGYDSETGKIDPDFDINTHWQSGPIGDMIYNYYTLIALPGSCDTSSWSFYAAGEGHIVNSEVVRRDFLLDPYNFSFENGWDRTVWNFRAGMLPRLITK
jgi:hypothetical protein